MLVEGLSLVGFGTKCSPDQQFQSLPPSLSSPAVRLTNLSLVKCHLLLQLICKSALICVVQA